MDSRDTGKPLVRALGVVKEYPAPGEALRALKSVDLQIFPGELMCILGKSGAGKTTLINMLTGVDHLTGGEVWIGDTAVHRLDEDSAAVWRGRNVGIVYQSFYLMPTLPLVDNVMLPMDLCGVYHPQRSRERALELLRMVDLQDHAFKLPSQISGGQQQRAAIARSLANDPPLIVADEPTGRLDSANAEIVFELFSQLVEQGKTVLMVTHDEGLARRASCRLTLEDGRFV